MKEMADCLEERLLAESEGPREMNHKLGRPLVEGQRLAAGLKD